ncbi:MAG: UTP--glucose-1-phosphate uridylyltransferase GalU [Halobacteriota archaeon]|nr:UTP--glucose-1-phosphate uridylyltransferase GalU [Halobacteriota archaeon]
MIKKAVIPAAGMGSRFLPATKSMPKEMLPVVDKPVIHYVVEEAISSGIDDIIIITGRGKRAIEDYFDASPELEQHLIKYEKYDLLNELRDISSLADIHYIRQKEPMGLGDAILKAEKHVGDDPFAVLLGDDIIRSDEPSLKELINLYDKYHTIILALEEVNHSDIKKYGIISGKEVSKGVYDIHNIVEKPDVDKAPSNIAVIGRYILTPQIFDCIKKSKETSTSGELQIADAFEIFVRTNKIFGKILEGERYDCGDKFGYIRTTIDFALADPQLKDETKEYLKRCSD